MENIKEKQEYVLIHSAYGIDESQYGNLYLPKGNVIGTVCLFHGGFWKMPYDLHQMDQLCEELIQHGFAVWNVEYRRTGVPDRKWTDPFEDTVKAVNHLDELQKTYKKIDLKKLIVVGHSAGGHLALWLGSSNDVTKATLKLKPMYILALAPVVDLIACYKSHSGKAPVKELLQCTPTENISRYMNTSPIELQLRAATMVFHGDHDDYLSIEMTRKYAEKNKIDKTEFSFVEIKGGDHMDFIDTKSDSTHEVITFLRSISDIDR